MLWKWSTSASRSEKVSNLSFSFPFFFYLSPSSFHFKNIFYLSFFFNSVSHGMGKIWNDRSTDDDGLVPLLWYPTLIDWKLVSDRNINVIFPPLFSPCHWHIYDSIEMVVDDWVMMAQIARAVWKVCSRETIDRKWNLIALMENFNRLNKITTTALPIGVSNAWQWEPYP